MKNFLKTINIIIFSSVIFILGTFNVSASSPDINSVDLSNINSLTGHTKYYALTYSIQLNTWDLVFFNQNTGYISISNNSNYVNDICTEQGACFSRLWSIKYNTSSPRYSAWYQSSDNGNTWTLKYSNAFSTDPISNGYIVKSTVYLKDYATGSTTYFNPDYELSLNLFDIDFEQGEVIIKDSSGAIANLVTYYLEPKFDNFVPDNYNFYYIENPTGGGLRDSHKFNLTYVEDGISFNGKTYHYYYNLPLFYNIGLNFSIYDSNNELIQENQFKAYLSSLTDISGFTMYDFRNYEFANMSYINDGSFGLSSQLNTNITINAINYNTNTKIDFLSSPYLINSNTDNNGVTWYDFNFNNEPIYLEFINNFNDSPDFYTYLDTYNLYLYFDNNAYVHLSGSPNSIESQNNIVNQQSYKDNQGNIIYNNNPIVIDIDNSNEFFQNLQRYFKDFDNDTFGLTGIITSPLNLIQNLLSNSCNALVIPLPYVNSDLSLPCMSSIYSEYFGGFYTIYQDITFGLVAYWVIVRILNLVKDFRNPDHDEIEVLDL